MDTSNETNCVKRNSRRALLGAKVAAFRRRIEERKLKSLPRRRKRERKKLKRYERKLCRNEIKAQRKMGVRAAVAAVMLIGLFSSSNK